MWWKGFLVVYLIGLRNIISSQPVINNGKAHEIRQTKYRECCPCPGPSGGPSFRDQDLLPSQISSLLHTPINECPCRFTGSDSEGSSSIFYPSFLRGAQPIEREPDQKQEPKPLLRPEVGLASSVLETLKEATEEEYKEALARDVTRNMLNAAEPTLLDAEHGSTRNSVTIVINPRDLENSYDAVPEASHAHETRCIHSPLRSPNLVSSRRLALPRLSKQPPKTKLKVPFHKSVFDMDNSPSNINESFDAQTKNHLGSKLKINPLLLSDLSNKVGEPVDTLHNSGTHLRKIFPEQCDFNARHESIKSPVFTLADLKNKLRDLTEVKNEKRINNIFKGGINQNKINTIGDKHGDIALKLPILKLTNFDTVYGKQSPLVKNILKLRDVELIPPRKTNVDDKPRNNYNFADLKFAGTEIKAAVMLPEVNNNQKVNECLTNNFSTSVEYIFKDSKEIEPNSLIGDINTSSIIPSATQEETEMKSLDDSSTQIIESVCNETEKPESSEEEDIRNNNSIDINFEDQNFENSGKCDEIADSIPESSIIIESTSGEQESAQNYYLATEASERNGEDCNVERSLKEISDPGFLTNTDVKNNNPSLPLPKESSRHISLKDDILRRLENLRHTIKSKLEDNDFDSSIYQSEQTPSIVTNVTNLYPISEKPITTQDLQKMSNSLLSQENSPTAKATISQETECNMNGDENLKSHKSNETYDVQNDKSSFNLYQFDESGIPPENVGNNNNENSLNTLINSTIQQDMSDSQNSKYNFDTKCDETYDIADEDVSANNEMSSQASSLNFDALRPQLSNNHRFSSPQEVEVQPSFLSGEKYVKKPFKIPSLEEIRESITNIIDAGQREEELGSTDTEPLHDSSNINTVQSLNSNLRLKSGQIRPLKNLERNSLIPILNLDSYKTRLSSPHITTSNPLKLVSMSSNPATTLNSLSLGKDKTISAIKSKSALNNIGTSIKEVPTLDNIRDLFKSKAKNSLKKAPFKLPITYAPENSLFTGQPLNSVNNDIKLFADNSVKKIKNRFKDTAVGNHRVFSQNKVNSDYIFDTFARKRDDMKEKLQALHLDFNDRLATIQDRLLDQTNLQSTNIPSYKDSRNKISLPFITPENERNIHKPFSERLTDIEPELLFKPKLLPKQHHEVNSQTNWLAKDSQVFYTPKGMDGNTMKHTTDIIKSKNLSDTEKLLNTLKLNRIGVVKKKQDKQQRLPFLRNGNVKISFTTTTITPVTNRKKIVHDQEKKFPSSEFMQKTKNERLSNAYRKRLKNAGDSNHSPSELVPARILSLNEFSNRDNAIKNLLSEPDINTLTQKQEIPRNEGDVKVESSAESVVPSTKGSTLISNMREALRSKFAIINKPVLISSPKNELDLKSISDTVQSPSEKVKKIEIVHPLKENTSYKCTMMCVKDS